MNSSARGEALADLAWLCPSSASLTALARTSSTDAWKHVRSDPGAVLIMLRLARPATPTEFVSAAASDAYFFEEVIPFLSGDQNGFADWTSPELSPIYAASLKQAYAAEELASLVCPALTDQAWAAGLLAGLGWLVIGVTGPALASACLNHSDGGSNLARLQHETWGISHADLVRRLNRRWNLPGWLTGVIGHLGLPAEVAESLGADGVLFRMVQLALHLCQQCNPGLGLPIGASSSQLQSDLNLSASQIEGVRQKLESHISDTASTPWQSPYNNPLLIELLNLAADNRRLAQEPVLKRLESDFDVLHKAFEDLKAGEAERLKLQKLAALAEFAAGAGHEINNPLAVISGQAQYLLTHEPDPQRQRALETIINNVQRIHVLLLEVMHFARPPQPKKEAIDLPSLMREAAQSLSDLARDRGVRVDCPEPAARVPLEADPGQVRSALVCLLRNAIEAAPAEGWAGMRLETPSSELVDVVVEDSGPGLSAVQAEHLFDPFYSGRQAGRGRGLGLPTAWRLATVHGGDIHYASPPEGPTRFILRLPRTNSTYLNGHNGV